VRSNHFPGEKDMQLQQTKVSEAFLFAAERLQIALDGRPEEQFDHRLAEGEWSIRQNVHHLADDLDVWSMCIKKAIATPGAVVRFEGFPGNDAWAEAMHFDQRSIQYQLELIMAHRRAVVDIVEHFADALERTMCIADAEGAIRATLSVTDILTMLTDHMNEHVCTIENILAMRDRK
jgi:hypothetical protein